MVSLSEKQQDAIRVLMSRAVESKTLPALFCGVTDQNGELFMHQAGRKVLGDPSSDPLDENTIFWICSQTKLITTIAALQLIEQGKLQLSTLVSDILPEAANPVIVTAVGEDRKPTATTPATTPLTIGHLLNHTSGMEYNLDGQTPGTLSDATAHAYGEDEDSSTFFRLNQVPLVYSGPTPVILTLLPRALFLVNCSNSNQGPPVGVLRFFPPEFNSNSPVAYGLSTDFLGFAIERVSGKSLDQYFKDHIFSPLGITSATFHLTPDLKKRLMPLSVRAGDNLEQYNGQIKIIAEKTLDFGGVGLYSSLKDYLALLRHFLQIQGGKAENPILKATSVDAIFQPTLNEKGANSLAKMFGVPEGSVQFGTGLMVTTVDFPGRRKKGTGAWAGWACTSHFIDPD
ncbi:beta-lactamase/transpeptidase-like protein [Mycena metata]|uniref:Beta-lactamase/transpeptidase-like protein n=1 Tax=Mycena metata TaxID=1033252 RepID=A0AAD7KFR9_9AGAR|nr:beta-lactamase/transpeptidase-like protein [Mycena metata]